MSQYVEGPTRTFSCSGAIGQFLRVKTPASLAVAGATDVELGTIERAAFAALDRRAVRLRTADGTCKMVAAGDFVVGATLYGAAAGKVDNVANSNRVGIALEAATADGDVIEVLRSPGALALGLKGVEAHTAGDTLTAAESGSMHTNTGAGDAIALVLPAATVGLEFFFQVGAAQELQIDPDGTETISLPSTGVAGAAGKYLVADAIGETVHLICAIAGTWGCFGYTGTWTAQG